MSNVTKVGAILAVILAIAGTAVQCARAEELKVGETVGVGFVCKSQDFVEAQIDSIVKTGKTDEAMAMLERDVANENCVELGGIPGIVTGVGKEREPVVIDGQRILFRAYEVNGKFWTGGGTAADPEI